MISEGQTLWAHLRQHEYFTLVSSMCQSNYLAFEQANPYFWIHHPAPLQVHSSQLQIYLTPCFEWSCRCKLLWGHARWISLCFYAVTIIGGNSGKGWLLVQLGMQRFLSELRFGWYCLALVLDLLGIQAKGPLMVLTTYYSSELVQLHLGSVIF